MPELEQRLQDRYESLVLGHVQPLQKVAAGVRALPDTNDTFAATQAAWRFHANSRTTLPTLVQPLVQEAQQAVPHACDDFALAIHDWSQLHYNHHRNKRDRVKITNSKDFGYELQTALLISDRDGQPIAPVFQSLRTADGVYSSHTQQVRQPLTKLDRLAPVMRHLAEQKHAKPLVHIIDREADSVHHYRKWAQQGRLFVVRADANRKVYHQGRSQLLPEVVEQLHQNNAFRHTREVLYKGQPQQQFVAETQVTLTRPAKRRQGRGHVYLPGRALVLRLVVAEVRNAAGEVLATWLLLCHVPSWVSAATLALWYYWRWDIESYFKLLKGAGLHLEHWQQETGLALAKRLLVAAMACVLVWKISRSRRPEAVRLREVLIQLSGRQMAQGVEATDPALLAGLWVLLNTLSVLEHYQPRELQQILQATLHQPDSPDPPPPKKDT